jgi:RNA-directed DNA polymerase
MPLSSLLRALASSLVAGKPTTEAIVDRLSRKLGRPWRWLRPLARRYVKAVSSKTRPRQREAVQFLRHDAGFRRAWARRGGEISIEQWLSEPAQMQPVAAAAGWDLPGIESPEKLAAWLGLTLSELLWFADLKGFEYRQKSEKLHHYRYRILPKPGGEIRLIEAPKPRLKEIQRRILSGILGRIPPHPAAHGFIPGCSIKTFTAAHVGQDILLRMDLRHFFPSLRAARVQTVFRTMGYPEPVADLLGGLCTNCTPSTIWDRYGNGNDYDSRFQARVLYCRPHLPQGASTSPALANICAYRIDCRLTGLARSAGAQFTRYADDLAFSGSKEFASHVERFSTHVAAILLEEGFDVHHRKTRVMRQGVRQHLAGVVLNRHVNIMRPDYDRLKATLANCVRHGPAGQNREAAGNFRSHLEGRLAFIEMINPTKGKRLRAMFEQIQW